MNRIDRLFAILLLLQSHRTLRASDIAEQFEIVERTVYRDIAALMQMGVPIVSLPGVGYQMMEGYYLPPLIFTPAEANALFVGTTMLKASGNFADSAQAALDKLRAALPERARHTAQSLAEIIRFYFPDSAIHLETPYLVQLREAILQKRTVHIRYFSRASTSLTERNVDPYGLMVAASAWYFHGYCHLRQDVRSFRLDRVQSLSLLNQHFSAQPPAASASASDLLTVRLIVNADSARWIRERQHYSFVGEAATSESIVMTYQVETISEIQPWILAWGASVEVLEPPALRQAVFAEAEAILKRRSPSQSG